VPLAPLGVWAILLDPLRHGHAVRPRFTLSAAGVVALATGVVPMLGLRPPEPAPPGSTAVTLLHWNVRSGGRDKDPARWGAAARLLQAREPDVIVLSETPPDSLLFATLRRRGNGWNAVQLHPGRGPGYWYNLLVCSRSPVTLDRPVPVRNGAAMAVTVRLRGGPLRLLVVDGMSAILLPRTPVLHDVAAACDEAARAGRPFDVVVGDFNAAGRSVGFDAVLSASGGYRRASDFCGGWRATWPAPLPVYDIDHVVARSGVAIRSCEILSGSLDTDHRGQVVSLALPRREQPE
jgi:endonuclease/exonuclease/phosphatase family metal-dependent hydrolase